MLLYNTLCSKPLSRCRYTLISLQILLLIIVFGASRDGSRSCSVAPVGNNTGNIWFTIRSSSKSLRNMRSGRSFISSADSSGLVSKLTFGRSGISCRHFCKFAIISSQILPVLFPTGATLAILEPYLRNQGTIVSGNIARSVAEYLRSRSIPVGNL